MMPPGPTLRDIHMPLPASWWPLAPGWWGLLVVLVIVVAMLTWYMRRRRTPRRQWRAARRELARLRADHRGDAAVFAAGVSQLLRRAARLRDPTAARLHDAAWHNVMRKLAGDGVSTQPLEGLERVMYRRNAALDTVAVADAAHAWLRRVLLHGGRHA